MLPSFEERAFATNANEHRAQRASVFHLLTCLQAHLGGRTALAHAVCSLLNMVKGIAIDVVSWVECLRCEDGKAGEI